MRSPVNLKIVQFFVLTGYATWLSVTPQPGEVLEVFWDKPLHTLGWLALCLSLRLALPFHHSIHPAAAWLFAYSILIEVIQHFVPSRQFSVLDILANGAGILLALGCIRLTAAPACRMLEKMRSHQPLR